jgi:chromosome segregation ATPase
LLRANDQAQSSPEVEPLRQKLAASEVERQQLENELDLLRHRGAELSQQLVELKRTAAAEREQWNEELRQLRKAVEMQSEALAHHAAAPRPAVPNGAPSASQQDTVSDNTRRTSSTGASRAEESVLGSVMEQFEALQKSKVRNLARPKR